MTKTQVIKTSGFTLRPFKYSDARAVAKHANDKDIGRNTTSIPYPYSLADAKSWLGKTCAGSQKTKAGSMAWAIDVDGEAVGSISLMNIKEEHKAELGYWLGKDYREQGIMGRAVKEVSNFGFKELRLRRVYARVFSFNKISARVLEKNGFKFEGVAKKDAKKNGKYIDTMVFAKVR